MIWQKLRMLFSRQAIAEDLDAEMQSHIDLETDENVARGMTHDAAREAALRKFGSRAATGQLARESWTFPRLETFLQDLRFGLRTAWREPALSLVIIAPLALGIGANTALFSLIDAVVLKPLPFPASDRLLWLGESTAKSEGISVTWRNFRDWQQQSRSFVRFAGMHQMHLTLTGRGEARLVRLGVVTNEFFPLTGLKAAMGRTLDPADDRVEAPARIVLSHACWTELGADPAILGRALTLDGSPYEVIGVAAPGPLYFDDAINDGYVSLGHLHSDAERRDRHGSIRVLGLLKPGVPLDAARAELTAIMTRIDQQEPSPEHGHRAYASSLIEQRTGDVRPALYLLMGVVALILLIACANVAGLTLARSHRRAKEIAIRAAIGAGRRRLARQILTENLVFAFLGGLAGVGLAWLLLANLKELAPRILPRLAEVSVDGRVLLFTTAVTLTAGLLIGLAPVLQAGKIGLVQALKESARTPGGTRFRGALVVAQIAITLVLAFSSTVLLRSLRAAAFSDPGFSHDRLLALELVLPRTAYPNNAAASAFFTHLTEDLRRLPGVERAAAVACPPGAGDCRDWFYWPEDRPAPNRNEEPVALFNTVDPAYFQAMGIPIRLGRPFLDTDREGDPAVIIVNRTLARLWWPRESAVGKRIKIGGPYMEGGEVEIVGEVGDVRQMGLDEAPMPEIFLPFAQDVQNAMTLMVRARSAPEALIPTLRQAVAQADPNLPIQRLRLVETMLASTLERRRFGTWLLSIFAGLALVLATVGVYGLFSSWVSSRQHEIAVRMALGANPGVIARWVGGHALSLAAIGLAIGAAGAWFAARSLQAFVYGAGAWSPLTLLGTAGGLVLIALAAAGIPAWRASRVKSLQHLREL